MHGSHREGDWPLSLSEASENAKMRETDHARALGGEVRRSGLESQLCRVLCVTPNRSPDP